MHWTVFLELRLFGLFSAFSSSLVKISPILGSEAYRLTSSTSGPNKRPSSKSNKPSSVHTPSLLFRLIDKPHTLPSTRGR